MPTVQSILIAGQKKAVGAEAESLTREHVVSQLATDSDDAPPIRSPASGVAVPL
jgi:hypothetical protein